MLRAAVTLEERVTGLLLPQRRQGWLIGEIGRKIYPMRTWMKF